MHALRPLLLAVNIHLALLPAIVRANVAPGNKPQGVEGWNREGLLFHPRSMDSVLALPVPNPTANWYAKIRGVAGPSLPAASIRLDEVVLPLGGGESLGAGPGIAMNLEGPEPVAFTLELIRRGEMVEALLNNRPALTLPLSGDIRQVGVRAGAGLLLVSEISLQEIPERQPAGTPRDSRPLEKPAVPLPSRQPPETPSPAPPAIREPARERPPPAPLQLPAPPPPEPRRPVERLGRLLQETRPITWIFLGDSITHGAVFTSGARSYPELFQEFIRWEKRRFDDTVINTATNGATAQKLRDQLEFKALRFHPDVVFIMIGINDAEQAAKGAGDPPSFRTRLHEVIRGIEKAGAIPVLQTPVFPALSDDSKRLDTTQEIVEVIRDLAKEKDLPLIDHWALWEDARNDPSHRYPWLGDRVHPNAEGHRQVAAFIREYLLKAASSWPVETPDPPGTTDSNHKP